MFGDQTKSQADFVMHGRFDRQPRRSYAEKLLKDVHTVQIRDLPLYLHESLLFDFFKGFGSFVKLDIEKCPLNGTQNATISFRTYFEALELKRYNGAKFFGGRICVDFLNECSPHNSLRENGDVRNCREQKSSLFRLTDELLLKVFELLNFDSRCRCERVCQKFHGLLTKNINKLAIAEDAPRNVTLIITVDKRANFNDKKIFYSKSDNILSIKVLPGECSNVICGRLSEVLHRAVGAVSVVRIIGLKFDSTLLLTLEKFCANGYRLTFDNCDVVSTKLNFMQSFLSQFDQRLTVEPEFDMSAADAVLVDD